MSKFGLPCAFFGKSDSCRFSTREIYAVYGKRCLQFFLAVLTSQSPIHPLQTLLTGAQKNRLNEAIPLSIHKMFSIINMKAKF